MDVEKGILIDYSKPVPSVQIKGDFTPREEQILNRALARALKDAKKVRYVNRITEEQKKVAEAEKAETAKREKKGS